MYKLSLPQFNFTHKKENGLEFILDELRKKYVRLTPEEWVRQHVIKFLIAYRNYPPSLIGVEVSMNIQGMQKRADIVCYNSHAQAVLVVECKAPEVKVTQAVLDQISQYNLFLKAPFLLVTNGVNHRMCRINFEEKSYDFIQEIPFFENV